MKNHRFFVAVMPTVEVGTHITKADFAREVPSGCTFNLSPSGRPGINRFCVLREVCEQEYQEYLSSDVVIE